LVIATDCDFVIAANSSADNAANCAGVNVPIWLGVNALHSTIGYVSPEQFESSLPKAA